MDPLAVRRPPRLVPPVLAGAVLVICAPARGLPVEFIRGDANSDGEVTIADAQHVFNLRRGGEQGECLAAMDTDASRSVNLTDGIIILNFLLGNGQPPPAPFPAPGPGGEAEVCVSYGNGTRVEDPAARLEVDATEAPGGDSMTAAIRILYSSSRPIAGYLGALFLPPELIASATSIQGKDLTGVYAEDDVFTYLVGRAGGNLGRDGYLRFGFLASPISREPVALPLGEHVPALEIEVCLAQGVRAGTYPIEITEGELVDSATGRAIRPALANGSLTVLADLDDGVGAWGPGCNTGSPTIPSAISARFEIGGATVTPGEEVSLPFIIRSNVETRGFAFSIDFDEEVLEAVAIEDRFPSPYGFRLFEFNNRNDHPGNGGIDEGFLVGVDAYDMQGNRYSLPPRDDHTVLRFQMRVRPEATAAATELRFLDGAQGSGEPVPNYLFCCSLGLRVTPETAGSFVLVNGVLNVLPEITIFIRGDANGDQVVDIGDAVHTLGYLFLGSERPACYDAADANDDGIINMVDPVAALNFLFTGGRPIPPPHPDAGEDPTADGLGCRGRHLPTGG